MGLILSFSGRSGTGKSSVIRSLLQLYPEWGVIESVSTRAMRDSDLPGEIRQVSSQEFETKKQRGDFAWFVQPHSRGTSYGTERASLQQVLAWPQPAMIIITPDIIPVLHQLAGSQLLAFFFQSPLEDVLYSRMHQRGDSPKDILGRLETSRDWQALVAGLTAPVVIIPPLTLDETVRFVLAEVQKHQLRH